MWGKMGFSLELDNGEINRLHGENNDLLRENNGFHGEIT